MQQTAYNNMKRPIGLGVMTALSVATLSATNPPLFSHDAHTSSRNQPYVYEGVPSYSVYGGDLCTSSTLSEMASGDIVTSEKELDYHADRPKIRVQLKIRQVKQHISHFDFDEDYEEI